jgi:hypothetical protein
MRAHLSEIAANKTPLGRAIHEATKSVTGELREVEEAPVTAEPEPTTGGYADHTSGGTAADMFVDREWNG